MMVNEQPRIESLDVLVHPLWGMKEDELHAQSDEPYGRPIVAREYAQVNRFIREHFSGKNKAWEYARLLHEMWKKRIKEVAANPTHALLFVPFTGFGTYPGETPTLQNELQHALGLYAQEQLETRCFIGLPNLEEQAREKVAECCTPNSTVSIYSYGEISYLCVLGVAADVMVLLTIRGVQIEHHHRLDLCGDRIEGKREGYARLVAEPEARP